jgi:DNA-binding NarL/FixJ family response regulator
MNTRVQIVEDDSLYAKLLLDLVDRSVLLTCVGVATTKNECLMMLSRTQADVFLLDVGLPDGSGLDLIRPILQVKPDAVIILLSTLGGKAAILEGLSAGASGYLMKSTPADLLLQHIYDALNHGATLSPSLVKIAVDAAKASRVVYTGHSMSGVELTSREMDVLNLLKAAHPSKKIATILNLSKFTVSQHLRNIYKKLNAKNRVEAISIARNLNFID